MRRTILVFEDDDDIRTVLSDLLREAGFRSVEVDHDGGLPSDAEVDLVLTDLPKAPCGYSADGARDWVTSVRDRYQVPVVVITAHREAASDAVLGSISAAVVMKPFELDHLMARVTDLAGAVRSGGAR